MLNERSPINDEFETQLFKRMSTKNPVEHMKTPIIFVFDK